jgi:zinc finger SWIM domain-containing protein 3
MNLKGIFFQDKPMKDAFEAYPELLCVDATYKLLELGLPTYIMVCEDSNGQSEIVSVCLLVSEDADSITWMMNSFKERNSEWERIRVVMADKDIGERDIIKQLLPQAAVLICLFHTLRTLRREITCEKMGITSGQRTLCLELVQKMAYSYSELEYSNLYAEFQSSAPKEVVGYFNDNWHAINDEWVLGMKSCSGNFLNFTNNRLESINGKLKQVINRHSSLEDFIENFFIILTALRTERDHKAAIMCQKIKVNPFCDDSPQYLYSQLLTNYAAEFVHKQLKLAEKVSDVTVDDGEYTIKTSEGPKKVTLATCECIFNKSMLLPCRHIFHLRSELDEPLFDASLCDQRWTTSYYKSTQRIFASHSVEPTLVMKSSKKHIRKLSQHQKFREASIITAELASVASVASAVHFQRRIELLRELVSYWKNSEEVALVEVDESKYS